MKLPTLTLAFTLIALSGSPAEGFAPRAATTRLETASRMVVSDNKKKNDWFADLMDNFFIPSAHATKKKKTVTETNADGVQEVEAKEDWVAEKMNDLSEELSDLGEELSDKVEKTVGKTEEILQDVVKPDETVKEIVQDSFKTKAISPLTTKKFEGRDDWVARDMNKAGRAEQEQRDWVAQDMVQTGRRGSVAADESDWVAKDMKSTGSDGGSSKTFLKPEDTLTHTKTRNELIEEDMRQAGSMIGDDFVQQDMARTGRAQEDQTTDSWYRKLNRALDSVHEMSYEDVFDDMKKIGKLGSDSTEWVQRDMEQVGKASPTLLWARTETTDQSSYKLSKETKKAYDTAEIKKDMENFGHAESRDWVAHDMIETGRNETTRGHSYLAPKDDLKLWMDKERSTSWVGEDMARQGKALHGSAQQSKSIFSKTNIESMIADDMSSVGKSSTKEDWIAHDMKMAGRADAHFGTDKSVVHPSHQERETQDFMKNRKSRTQPLPDGYHKKVEAPDIALYEEFVDMDDGTDAGDSTASLYHKPKPRHSLLRRVVSKAFMPWKKWKTL